MADDAGNFSGGARASGGDDWDYVSLTASTYAAAPGPVLPHLLDAHKKTEYPTPHPAATIFMSQYFNLPVEALLTDLNGEREQKIAMVDDGAGDTDDPNTPCLQVQSRSARRTDQNDGLTLTSSDSQRNMSTTLDEALVKDAGNALLPAEERKTIMFCYPAPLRFDNTPDAAGSDHIRSTSPHNVSSDAATVGIITVLDSAPLTANAVPVATHKVPFPKIPCEAHAWWKKTFRFLHKNSKESLTFRFIFVAATVVGLAILGQRDKLQLRLEFNVDSEKISCAMSEPLGQVKLSMLLGGSPIAHG